MDLDSAQSIDGYCWYVMPERGDVPGVQPFSLGRPSGAEPGVEVVQRPPGVEDYWALGGKTVGIHNRRGDRAYLIVTRTGEPPAVNPGWSVEPARLDDDFQIDPGGSRWVNLIRVRGAAESPLGPVSRCEFEVVRG